MLVNDRLRVVRVGQREPAHARQRAEIGKVVEGGLRAFESAIDDDGNDRKRGQAGPPATQVVSGGQLIGGTLPKSPLSQCNDTHGAS